MARARCRLRRANRIGRAVGALTGANAGGGVGARVAHALLGELGALLGGAHLALRGDALLVELLLEVAHALLAAALHGAGQRRGGARLVRLAGGGVALLLAALGALAFVARVALGASLRRFGVDDLALGGVDGAARLAFARGTRRRARVGLAQQICARARARVGELAGDGERVRRGVACL